MKKIVSVVVVVMLVGLGVGCADKEAQTALAEMKAQAAVEARNVEVIKTLLAEINKGNLDIFQKLYAPDFKYYFPSNTSTPMSREDEMAMAKMMKTAIPDMDEQITEIFAVKDRVIVRFFAYGTHKAALEGVPATGNKLTVSAICIFRLKDGIIVEEVEEANMLGLYQQIGMELKPKASAK
jgi:steroid delta-isomerase-like uncharacterized protein